MMLLADSSSLETGAAELSDPGAMQRVR